MPQLGDFPERGKRGLFFSHVDPAAAILVFNAPSLSFAVPIVLPTSQLPTAPPTAGPPQPSPRPPVRAHHMPKLRRRAHSVDQNRMVVSREHETAKGFSGCVAME